MQSFPWWSQPFFVAAPLLLPFSLNVPGRQSRGYCILVNLQLRFRVIRRITLWRYCIPLHDSVSENPVSLSYSEKIDLHKDTPATILGIQTHHTFRNCPNNFGYWNKYASGQYRACIYYDPIYRSATRFHILCSSVGQGVFVWYLPLWKSAEGSRI